MSFQRTVTKVLALNRVTNVLALNNYGLLTTDYGLLTTDYGLLTTDYGLRTTDYGLLTSPAFICGSFRFRGSIDVVHEDRDKDQMKSS